MNTKQKISILTLVAIALALSYWVGYLHGSSFMNRQDMIASMALPVIFIWTLAKLTFAWSFRRDSLPPSSGGSPPPNAPFLGVPVPRPPGAPPEIICEHTV